MSNMQTTTTGGFNLKGLIPWLTRAEPITRPLKTKALESVYTAATTNIQRTDAIIQTIASAFYGVHVATGEAERFPPSEEHFLEYALANWESATTTGIPVFGLGIEGVLSAVLVQAHATFETFSGDMWGGRAQCPSCGSG